MILICKHAPMSYNGHMTNSVSQVYPQLFVDFLLELLHCKYSTQTSVVSEQWKDKPCEMMCSTKKPRRGISIITSA